MEFQGDIESRGGSVALNSSAISGDLSGKLHLDLPRLSMTLSCLAVLRNASATDVAALFACLFAKEASLQSWETLLAYLLHQIIMHDVIIMQAPG